MNKTEHREQPPQEQENKIVVIDGKKYKRVPSGYTIKEWYSHETMEKGPGPGWDFRWPVLEKYGVMHPRELPDTPYYTLEEVEE